MLSATFTIALLVGGTALVVQFVLMLLGLGEGDELSVDGSPDALANTDLANADAGDAGGHWFYEMLSLRTLSAALAFFGLTGKTMLAYGIAELPTFVISTLVGIGALYAVYWLFKQVYRLQNSGTENIRNSIGLPATVYVPIPANRGGTGKVTFKMQNRLVEYQAVTEDGERLATGAKVVVVEVVNSDTVRVRRDPTTVVDAPAAPSDLASSTSN
jgi:hypothetical protein